MPGARWFPGATLNYAEHALAAAESRTDGVAVVAHSQTRGAVELTWGELADQVGRCRAGLQRLGVGRGDRVAAYLPNIPETLVAFLATASLGAVWSSCAPEFGTRSVVDRFAQIEPVVLLAVDGYRYGEKVVDRPPRWRPSRAALPTRAPRWSSLHLGDAGAGADDWDRAARRSRRRRPVRAGAVRPPALRALLSSGTTGLPKPIVHGHGGITARAPQERSRCTTTSAPATGSSGSPRPAG